MKTLATTLFSFLLSLIFQAQGLPNFQRFTLGDINGTVLTDGLLTLCSNPFQLSDKRYVKRLESERRVPIPGRFALNVVIMDIHGKRVMVDAGSYIPSSLSLPNYRDVGKLLQSMEMAEFTPESIDAVILTHGHQDHALGLVAVDGTAAFKNALVYVSKVEHEYWTTNYKYLKSDVDNATVEMVAQLYQRSIEKYSGRLRLVKNGTPFRGVQMLPVPGHTPGHSVIKFTGNRPLYVAGDAWVFQAIQLKTPKVKFLFDTNRSQAVYQRIKLLHHLHETRALVLSYHEPFPGLGYVDKTRSAFQWIPAVYEELQPDSSSTCV